MSATLQHIARDVERPDQLVRRQAHARQHLQSTEWGRGRLRLIQEHEVKHPPVVSGERSQPEPRTNLRARPPPSTPSPRPARGRRHRGRTQRSWPPREPAVPAPRGAAAAARHGHRGLDPRRLALRDRHGARRPRLLRPQRPARPRALHPVRAPDDRGGLRRPWRRRDRAGPGVPAGGDVRRGAPIVRDRPSSRPRTRTSSPIRAWTTARCRGSSRRRRRARWRSGGRVAPGSGCCLPQGGSTLTQQLVRGYFLQDLTRPTRRCARSARPGAPRLLVRRPGRPRHEQAAPEAGGGAPDPLARGEMRTALRNAGAGQARDLRPLRQLHLPGQRPLRLRRRVRVLLRQDPVELHGRRRRTRPRCWRASASRRGTTRRARQTRDRCTGATRSWP